MSSQTADREGLGLGMKIQGVRESVIEYEDNRIWTGPFGAVNASGDPDQISIRGANVAQSSLSLPRLFDNRDLPTFPTAVTAFVYLRTIRHDHPVWWSCRARRMNLLKDTLDTLPESLLPSFVKLLYGPPLALYDPAEVVCCLQGMWRTWYIDHLLQPEAE